MEVKFLLQNSVINELAFFFLEKNALNMQYSLFSTFCYIVCTIISNDANLGQSIVVDHGRNRDEPGEVFPSWNLE